MSIEPPSHDSAQRYRLLFDHNPLPMLVYDLETLRFLAVNEAMVDHYGYAREEFLAMTIADLHPAEDVPALRDNVDHVTEGIDHAGVWRHRLKNGLIIRVRIDSQTLEFEGRRAELVLARDVTEQLAAEDALREKESLLRLAGKVTRVGGWAVELPDNRLHWSDEINALLDYPPGVVPSLAESLSWYPPEYRITIESALATCARDGTPFDLELELFTAKGRRIQARAVGEAERAADGTITRLVGAFQDISAQKQAAREHQRLATRLHATLENMTDAFVLIDPAWRFVYLNTRAERILQCRREDLLGRNMWEMFPEGRETIAYTEYHKAVATGLPRRFELHYPPLDEWLEVNAYPTEEGLALYFKAITGRKALEEQLRQSQRLESVGQLTGGVAHDFNNLLTVIQGNAELLQEELAADTRLRPLAETINDAAGRGGELTHRLLAFARKQALEPRIVDINALVTGMEPLLRRTLGEHIEIEFLTAANPWPALIDPGQLENALLNLAINARDAMPQGGQMAIETLNTELDAYYAERHAEVRPGDYVLVAVSDTGGGIPPEQLERVFEPFFTTKAKGKGTGLGLSMVYGFVKQSDGHIKLYSEPDQGTTLKLYLPRAIEPINSAPDPWIVMEHTGGHETILLVEDNDMVRGYAETQLRTLGYRVFTAANGPEALDIVREHDDIDLLFTDIVMPGGMNGRDLADAVRQLRPELKVLYTSGYTENAIVHHGRLDPGVRLLSKPYRRAELARRIREALDFEG